MERRISIGQAKSDLSDVVNRVAYGGERIILTSRGRPKAAIVSIEDYGCLEQERQGNVLAQWELWLAQSEELAADVLERRDNRPLELDVLWQAARADLEDCDAQVPAKQL